MNHFVALADPTRCRIVEMLASSGQLPVSEIHKRFKITAPAISQHLKVLREAKLVSAQVRGQQRIYSINRAGVEGIEHWVMNIKQHWDDQFDALDTLLAKELSHTKKPRRKK